MAFNPEEEAKLRAVIVAFDNGKQVDDLPTLDAETNPLDLKVEVLDTDGASKQAHLANLLPYLEEQCAYGIEFDTNVASPDCTRIGNSYLHRSLPVQSLMKGCLLNDDGEVVKYLNGTDWTGEERDGSLGQVMVEFPDYYRKFVTNGTKRQVWFSLYPLQGYHKVHKHYMSAYKATVDRSNNKLASVVNYTAQYRGGGNQSAWDNTYRSQLGRPATDLGRQTFRSYARNRKSGSTQWNCLTYEQFQDLYWLFVVEYATLNSQKAYNAQIDGNGFRQGGLGSGVTEMNSTIWNEQFNYYPILPNGMTDSFGNGTGVTNYEVKKSDGTTCYNASVPRYRGIENPFGHIYDHCDGLNIKISPNVADGGDGTSKVYTCANPASFNDSNYNGYTPVGQVPRANGYGKTHIFGDKGEILPSAGGGGSTTYLCDYFYTSIPTSESLRCVLFGGGASAGSDAGFVYAYSDYAPSFASALIGSRLCFLP